MAYGLTVDWSEKNQQEKIIFGLIGEENISIKGKQCFEVVSTVNVIDGRANMNSFEHVSVREIKCKEGEWKND